MRKAQATLSLTDSQCLDLEGNVVLHQGYIHTIEAQAHNEDNVCMQSAGQSSQI